MINLDALYAGGPARDIVVVGSGNPELEDDLRKVAKQQDRVIAPEPTPEKGFYYRSDHFNFAKKGVPALYTSSAPMIVSTVARSGTATGRLHR